VVGWILLGLAVRLVLVPFHHPWDLQTWYNMFVDLARDRSPYETFRDLTYLTRALWGEVAITGKFFDGVRASFYGYYAYPPLPLLLYYPLAKLYAAVHPLAYRFVVEGAVAAHRIPASFGLVFKAPLFVADLGVALLLWRLAGERAARAFFLNPLVVLVSGAWMIDSLAAVFAVLGLLLARQGRHGPAGAALALGALAKWIPAVLWPAVGLWLLRRGAPPRAHLAFHAAFLTVLAAGLLPFWDGIRLVAEFHAQRPGGNLTPHILLYVLAQFGVPHLDLAYHVISPLVGTVTLPAALLVAYVTIWRRALPLSTAAALVLIAFLLGSKTVNEPYVYLLLPILLWEAAERPTPAKTVLFRAVYALPLAFAIVGVPVLMFALPLYVHLTTLDPVVGYTLSPVLPRQPHALALAVIALAFVGTLLWGWCTVLKETEHALPAAVP